MTRNMIGPSPAESMQLAMACGFHPSIHVLGSGRGDGILECDRQLASCQKRLVRISCQSAFQRLRFLVKRNWGGPVFTRQRPHVAIEKSCDYECIGEAGRGFWWGEKSLYTERWDTIVNIMMTIRNRPQPASRAEAKASPNRYSFRHISDTPIYRSRA